MSAEAAKSLPENDDAFVVLVLSVRKRAAAALDHICRTFDESPDDIVSDAIELAADRSAGAPPRSEVEQLATLMGCDPDVLARAVLE